MSDPAENLANIRRSIEGAVEGAARPPGSVRLVAISKTIGLDAISQLLVAGQRDYGENRVQEAVAKWTKTREERADVRLHLVGPLQSNKAADAVALFDSIHTVDRDKIAGAIASELAKQDRVVQLFVQVNTGGEAQKSGVRPADTEAFISRCRDIHGLVISGLMTIPPANESPGPHFALLAKLGRESDVARLSMGMTGDFETAIAFGATDVRIGRGLFGARPTVM
jgi:hypothetical protein